MKTTMKYHYAAIKISKIKINYGMEQLEVHALPEEM